jgi:hypothetical protein
MTEETKKISKISKIISSYELVNDEEDFYDSEEENLNQNLIDEQKYSDFIHILQRNILSYVNDKSLPLCEYLTYDKINSYIYKYF